MHDIDRISLESQYGGYGSAAEFENYEAGAYGNGNEFEYEHANEFESPYQGYGEAEADFEFQPAVYSESPFTEAEELALASELLNVTNEDELDQFIGKLIGSAGKALKGFLKTPLGSQLGGIIKGAAKTALPLIGGAAGNFLIPGAGGAMGSKLASAAGSLLGLELEGLSREDQEFELARQIVRFGGAATMNATEMEQTSPAPDAAQQAAVAAAQQYAPGLLRANTPEAIPRPRQRRRRRSEGRWLRRGNKILIIGV